MSIDIGSVRLEDPVILAPMSGVTDLPFRRLVKRHGAGLVVSEMIASEAMIRETRQSLAMARNCPEAPRHLRDACRHVHSEWKLGSRRTRTAGACRARHHVP